MLYVHFVPSDNRLAEVIVTSTMVEAMTMIQLRHPHAIRRCAWEMNQGHIDLKWMGALLRVWPHSQAMELDFHGDRLAAVIVNESGHPPEIGARIFFDVMEIVDWEVLPQ